MYNSSDVLLVGVSGASCSGKSTLCQLLHAVYDNSIILHEDDFYKTDALIPIHDGYMDWDCVDAIDFPKFHEALVYIKQHGELPKWLLEKEANQNVATKAVVEYADVVQAGRSLVTQQPGKKIILVDGFMLYVSNQLIDSFDVRIMLRADYNVLKQRREARTGYVTTEGSRPAHLSPTEKCFWQDPPGYFDKFVWPGYKEGHQHLFENDNVEGRIIDPRINITHRNDMTVYENLVWTIELLQHHLQ
ncbi:nicotinamide riboside kinase [Schizosaccharomyces japonicus yFS275]|uniref:Nicotinamide riboside kinase n=1 Tax=Schizosaccharomyces japonicus (strain yFS275 / FY16936) TaxID=402676 RepID=B6K7I1_SCHJY|nr:nicotinamide riboside kinase [Schizosaccharomyces japonicus yFS275]EEB09485.2 nicotinamide riboside kinase [Schizosaccharomyces japonicus yFS275]